MELANLSSVDREEFERLLASHQGRLFGFIRSLLGSNPTGDVEDILQKTNLILLGKAEKFELGTNFTAWAFQVAKFQVMQHRDSQRRENRVVPFSEDLLETLAIRSEEKEVAFARRQKHLRHCLEQLPVKQFDAVRMRYLEGISVAKIAEAMSMKPNAISQLLHRGKDNLLQCIERQLGDGHFKES
ncbi:MAG: sigma-70 family RNA polymerase sigma factor [Verrucomicrobiota bacterium]